MERTLADAIREADVAFVGTLVGTDQPIPAAMQPRNSEIVWSWDVERSRDAISTSRIDLVAWPDDGANCGVSFGVREKWLVIAHNSEGRLTSSSCAMNQRMDGVEPEVEDQVAGLLTVVPAAEPAEPAASAAQPLSASVPVIFVVGAVALLAAASGWGFLRRRPS